MVQLWYVLLMERNRLESERMRAKGTGEPMRDPSRIRKCRKSMARIKVVLGERERARAAAAAEAEAAQ